MERTEYFNYTKPSQTQLNNTEDSKIRAILRRFRSLNQMGIRTGFIVTVNSDDTTLIDIGPGEGYTGGFYRDENIRNSYSGERISTITDSTTGDPGYTPTVTGQALADYTQNVKNYVCLVYSETSKTPLAERYYPFTTHNTLFEESFSVSVLTETQWNNLTANELGNRILIAIVTAQGAGNALEAADIQQVVQPKTHPTTTQPSSITGVTITGIGQDTLIGIGTLRFESTSKSLYWTAPGDTEGSAVQITSSGVYTLYSDSASYWLQVECIFASLPSADTSESISVYSLYGRTIPMASAVDAAHRDMVGSGIPTTTNPHGITLDDIEGGTNEHADLFHVNGIAEEADSEMLECSIDAVNDKIDINNPGLAHNKFLLDGITYNSLGGVSIGTDGSVYFEATDTTGNYMIYLDSDAVPQKVYVGQNFDAVSGLANIELIDIKNTTGGNCILTWDASADTLTWQAQGDGAAGDETVVMGGWAALGPIAQGYYKIYSSETDNWIIVLISASPGMSDAATINIEKNETEHPDEAILKLCIVHWNATTETLSNLRDIRHFITADNREATQEEHDEDGNHTKVLQNQLRIGVASCALYARAVTGSGIFGQAAGGDLGVYGSASQDMGVKGIAGRSYGGSFSAGTYRGVYGIADTIGGYFKANDVTGVYATAPNTAIYGEAGAGGNIGVRGSAGNTAAYFTAANNTGIAAIVESDVAGYFYAKENTAGYFVAGTNTAVYATADNVAVYGKASAAMAGYFTAVDSVLCASASGDQACYFAANSAGATCVVISARGSDGLGIDLTGGTAGAGQGAYISAYSIGVKAVVPAAGATGIVVTALGSDGIGVEATGGTAGFGHGFYGRAGYAGAYVSGGIYGIYIVNTIRYDLALTDDGALLGGDNAVPASCSFVPINIGGNEYRLAIFSFA